MKGFIDLSWGKPENGGRKSHPLGVHFDGHGKEPCHFQWACFCKLYISDII